MKNQKANMLAQQASSYDVGGRNFHIQEQPMHENLSFFHAGVDQSAKPNYPSWLNRVLDYSSLAGQADYPSRLSQTPLWPARSPRPRISQIGPS
jgi:hypothetical protein